VPWNLHEKTPNNFDFENELDIVKFIKIAGELKLKVICRPGQESM
jgi:beta-galactosidase GanA